MGRYNLQQLLGKAWVHFTRGHFEIHDWVNERTDPRR
jgi:hypothetical protein